MTHPGEGLWRDYVVKLARGVSHLVAMRLIVEVRRDARCPTAADLASPRYTALRSPPVLGDAVRVTIGEDTLTVRPPVWADDGKHSWTIHCP